MAKSSIQPLDEGRPTVSILCTAYMHGAFIRKALEGFLAQRVKFPIEIIVHDDASTDDTASIIQEYVSNHPGTVKAILQSENQHRKGRGRVIKRLYSAATGKYIALCEGDDYWMDPDKLQTQIDLLESNHEAIACFTDAFNETGGERIPFMDHGYARSPSRITMQEDIIRGQGIPTCTFIFRRVELQPFYDLISSTPVVDTILFTYLAGFGHFIYHPERTAVRVIHPGGVYSMQSSVRKLDIHLRTLPFMDQLSEHKYSDLLAERRRKILNQAWSEAITTNNRELGKYVWPMIAKERERYGWNITTTARNFFKAYWPWPDRIFARLAGK